MSFPNTQGAPWYLWANGFPLRLVVTTVGADGVVGGTISEIAAPPMPFFDGTWDDQLKKLQFKHSIADTGEVQTYVGFLFDQLTYFNHSPLSTPQDYTKPYWVLAGSFTSVGGFENPDRAAAGWGWFAVAAAT